AGVRCHRLLVSLLSLDFSLPPSPVLSTLSLHDALPISEDSSTTVAGSSLPSLAFMRASAISRALWKRFFGFFSSAFITTATTARSEEHTSDLQSRFDLVCRLLLEKKEQGRGGELRSVVC